MLFKNKKMSRIVALLLTAALSFSANSFVFAGENSSSVLLGDVNGDGKVKHLVMYLNLMKYRALILM